jgi:hypothetical protein
MWKGTGRILTLAFGLAMILAMTTNARAVEVVNRTADNLKGGDIRNILFTIPEDYPWIWRMTAVTADGWVHVPDTQSPDESPWVPTGFTGKSGYWTSIEIESSGTPERNFQQTFSGQIRPDAAGGGEPQQHSFTIIARAGEYFVEPTRSFVCVDNDITLTAYDIDRNTVNSTWSISPADGVSRLYQFDGTYESSSVTFSSTEPGEYTVTGTNVGNSEQSDSAVVTFVEVELSIDQADTNSSELDEEDGKAQFATVKGDGNVILKATVNPDKPEIRDIIDWQGAAEDASDPLKATVARSTSKKQDVAVLLNGKKCCEAIVWVVWATIDLITSDPPGTPDDCELDPENMPDNPPIEYGAEGVYIATTEDNWPEGSFHFQNGILLRGTISPAAFSNRNGTVNFKFVRTIESCRWVYWENKNEWSQRYPGYNEPGTDDGPSEQTQDILPSAAGHIYSLDAPGLLNLIGNDILTSEQVQKLNASEWIEIELPGLSWQACCVAQEWHSSVWVSLNHSEDKWKRSPAEYNLLGAGHIEIEDSNEPSDM